MQILSKLITVSALFTSLFFHPFSAPLFPQTAFINEFMASNGETLRDEDGDYEDWIEIYNAGDRAVNLEGWSLTDKKDNPALWVFPDYIIESNQYLIVFASGKDRKDSAGELHTNFRLSKDGEYFGFFDPDGNPATVFDPAYPEQFTDIAYAYFDGVFLFTNHPTPGAANAAAGYSEKLDPPVFSHPSGLYSHDFELSITHPDTEVAVYYTLDMTIPDPEDLNGNTYRYNEQFSVTGTAMICAIAYKEGCLPSEPETMIYSQISEDLQTFESNLPIIVLHQFKNTITPDHRTPASAMFINHNYGDTAKLTGAIALQSRILANMRGSSSLMFPKNMFGFHLVNDYGSSRAESVFGLPAEHNWILYAPYNDKTLMRNAVAYTLGRGFERWAPRIRFVELFLHSGSSPVNGSHYHGVYVLVERIKWGENRINIRKIRADDNAEPEISGGYIIKKDRINEGEHGMATDRGTRLAFVRPNETDITTAQKNYIRNYMSAFERVLYSSDFTNPQTGYESFIDIDSFIDHFLITELLKEIDGYRLSTFMYKDRNQKLVMGPVWDFNLSLGNADYLEGWMPEGWYYPLISPHNHGYIGCAIRDWYVRLMQDPNYQQKLSHRWWQLRQNLFSNENLSNLIQEFRNSLSKAQVRNFTRWPILGYYVWPNWYIGQTWDDEVNWMHNWLMKRLAWIDSQMGEMPFFPESILINEICYHPSVYAPGDWVELYNKGDEPFELSGWKFHDSSNNDPYLIPYNTVLNPGSFLVIAKDTTAFRFAYPDVPALGPFNFGLSSSGERLVLLTPEGFIADEVDYKNEHPWPQISDMIPGTLALISPELDNNLPENWKISVGPGTPGASNNFQSLHPEPFAIADSVYIFDHWSKDEPEYSYPPNMKFWQSDAADPGADYPLNYLYCIPDHEYHGADAAASGFPYNNTRRTRINGLDEHGISFINTGRERDLGGAVLALDTRNAGKLNVSFTAGTVEPNSRVYGLRLQVRIGDSGNFMDVLDESDNPVEYRRNENPGHTQEFGPVELPADLLDQPYVQLLWRYYHISGDSGARAELRLDDVKIEADKVINDENINLPSEFFLHQNFPNPFNQSTRFEYSIPVKSEITFTIYSLLGRRIQSILLEKMPGSHIFTWDGTDKNGRPLESGVYLIKMSAQGFQSTKKMVLIR